MSHVRLLVTSYIRDGDRNREEDLITAFLLEATHISIRHDITVISNEISTKSIKIVAKFGH